MLTQAHLVPDLSGFWEALSKTEVVKPVPHPAALLPADTVVWPVKNAGELVLNRDAALEPACTETEINQYSSPRHTRAQSRVIATKKLYLIFCQLRIDG